METAPVTATPDTNTMSTTPADTSASKMSADTTHGTSH
jgi:hypothetical protein